MTIKDAPSLQLSRHRDGAVDLFPAFPKPEPLPGRVVPFHENDGSLQARLAQAAHAIIEKHLAHALPAILLRHRKMVNPTAPSIVSTHHRADDFSLSFRDPTQSRVSL